MDEKISWFAAFVAMIYLGIWIGLRTSASTGWMVFGAGSFVIGLIAFIDNRSSS